MKNKSKSINQIKPIEGFHVMEFIQKIRDEDWKKTRNMTREQREAYYASKKGIGLFGKK